MLSLVDFLHACQNTTRARKPPLNWKEQLSTKNRRAFPPLTESYLSSRKCQFPLHAFRFDAANYLKRTPVVFFSYCINPSLTHFNWTIAKAFGWWQNKPRNIIMTPTLTYRHSGVIGNSSTFIWISMFLWDSHCIRTKRPHSAKLRTPKTRVSVEKRTWEWDGKASCHKGWHNVSHTSEAKTKR